MRILFTLISTFYLLSANSQTKTSILFYDACEESVVELPYVVHYFDQDTTIWVEAGESINLPDNYYQIEVQMIWNEMLTSFFSDYYKGEQHQIDTLFLEKTRFFGPMSIHPDPKEFKYYCCTELCNGVIEEFDPKGKLRFRGRFKNGRAISKLKYYNSSGKKRIVRP